MRVRIGAYELGKRGAARYDLRDPYYLALGLSWPWFLLLVLGGALFLNGLFGALYVLEPDSVANARPGSFADHFFFSIETLATVGYGDMYPATFYGHVIASAEVICGMGFTALATGLAFVRFSRPKARIVYADKVVVTTYRGRRTLMIRIANGRLMPLMDACVHLCALLATEYTPDGQFFRSIHELELAHDRMPIFGLTWTLMHDLEGDSPLHGYDAARIAAEDVRIFLTLEARDPLLAANIHDTHGYAAADIVFGQRYADAVTLDTAGRPVADLTRVSELEIDGAQEQGG